MDGYCVVKSGDEAEWVNVGRLPVEADGPSARPSQFANDEVTTESGETGRAEVVFDRWRRWIFGLTSPELG